MNVLKKYIKVFLITFFLFIGIDFWFGKRILEKINILYIEELIRVPNEFYSYSFKKNLNTNNAIWGSLFYKLCTDSRGFKFNCNDKEIFHYDIAFIGDSFVEGIGLPYEKTFVGIFHKNKKFDVVNLGVASYSPKIYLDKIKHLISNEIIKFDHLIVGIDLTDLGDDWLRREINTDKKKNNNSDKIYLDIIGKINKVKIFNFKKTIIKNFSVSYVILKRINWFVKINILKTHYTDHLDYVDNNASWSYMNQYKDIQDKINNHLNFVNELFLFLNKKDIKMSILIYPHQSSIKFDKKNSLYKSIWSDFCINKCHKFIDAYSIFFDELKYVSKNQIMKKYYIKGDSHFNEEGNRKVFKVLDNHF